MKIKIKSMLLMAVVVAVAALFTGCSTMINGQSEKITVTSNPPGAKVELSDGQIGKTPQVFKVKRKGDLQIWIRKDGYETFETTLLSTLGGTNLAVGTTLNLLWCPIIYDYIDYKTGANYRHEQNTLHVDLVPLEEEE